MQSKPRSSNSVPIMERLLIWAGRTMIALVLLCESYLTVDIVRMLRTAYAEATSSPVSASTLRTTTNLARRTSDAPGRLVVR
jgi:hypothetical protein